MLTVAPDLSVSLPADGPSPSLIDQIVREGARQMLAAALQAEVADAVVDGCQEPGLIAGKFVAAAACRERLAGA
jgi:hypothetical protein